MLEEENKNEMQLRMNSMMKDHQATYGRILPFPETDVEAIVINEANPDEFCVLRSQNLSSFNFKNYISSEDVKNFRQTMNSISSDRDAFERGSDLFMLTVQKMRRDKIYNIDENGNIEDSSGVKTTFKGSAGIGARDSTVKFDGITVPIGQLKDSRTGDQIKKIIVGRRSQLSQLEEVDEEDSNDTPHDVKRLSALSSVSESDREDDKSALISDSRGRSGLDATPSSYYEGEGESSYYEGEGESSYEGEGESGSYDDEATPSGTSQEGEASESGEGDQTSEESSKLAYEGGEDLAKDSQSSSKNTSKFQESSSLSRPRNSGSDSSDGYDDSEESKQILESPMMLLPSVPTKLNADNEDKQLKEPIMGNYDLDLDSLLLASSLHLEEIDFSIPGLDMEEIDLMMKEVDREIDEILADSERKTVENQTAPFVPVDGAFPDEFVDDHSIMKQSTGSVQFCRMQN